MIIPVHRRMDIAGLWDTDGEVECVRDEIEECLVSSNVCIGDAEEDQYLGSFTEDYCIIRSFISCIRRNQALSEQQYNSV